jgi:hypothetical protein
VIHLRLSDVDRERLGGPEWLDLDHYSVTAREAAILQRGFDLDGEHVAFEHPGEWRKALSPDGDSPWAATLVLVWLALRRAGVQVALADLDFNLDSLAYRVDPSPEPAVEDAAAEASPGKDDEPQPSPSDGDESSTSVL